MHITDSIIDNIVVIALQGSLLGGEDSVRLQTIIKSHLALSNKKFILDLTHVDFVNSMGLGTLLSVYTSVKREGGRMYMTSIGLKVMEILRITQCDKLFNICSSVEAGKAMINEMTG